jgi:D-sedoheptulose 7-phosphate isomerase
MRINFNSGNVDNNSLLDDLIGRYPRLSPVKSEIAKAAESMIKCYQKGGKLLICGNGGSSSDSGHIAGELMKSFEQKRPVEGILRNNLLASDSERGLYLAEKLQHGFPAIALTVHNDLISAIANDTDADLIFAQQVVGYGNPGDVLIAISTSGNSRNVLDAIITARAKGMVVIGLTGETGGKMKSLCEILINVPGKSTALVQELHLPVYHTLCRLVENAFFGNKTS